MFKNYLNLIKPFFPSWKFYDNYDQSNLLFYQIKENTSDEFSEWKPLYQTPQVHLSMLLFNPDGNLKLAAHSHFQYLLYDIENHNSLEPFSESLSYKLTKNLVQYALVNKFSTPFIYRFKYSSVSDAQVIIEDIIQSADYEVLD